MSSLFALRSGGLVGKAPTRERLTRDLRPCFPGGVREGRRGSFPYESYSDSKFGTPVAALSGAWCDEPSASPDFTDVGMLSVGEIANLIYTCHTCRYAVSG